METLILIRTLEYFGQTSETPLTVSVFVCMRGAQRLPLPLWLCACPYHHAAILPSVLAENQVPNAL